MRQIVYNAVRCLKCNETIESNHVHDYKHCSCGNAMVDGGMSYERYGGEHNTIEKITIYADDETSLYVNTWTTGTNTYADIEVWLSGRLRIIAEEDSSAAAVNTRNIKRIALSYVVESGVQPVHAVLYFDEMTVHCASYNELKVQNRSLSATGSSSTDTVNNNPLQGKIYDFSTQPRTAIEYMRPIMIFDASTGILLSRAAQFNDIANMKEPPSGRIFNNTKKTDKIVLQAGEIKKGNLYYKLNPFLPCS